MKCDELKDYVAGIDGILHKNQRHGDVYLKDDVDAAIAELKKKLMPCLNGDCILTCEVVEKYGKENAELKAENVQLKKETEFMHSNCKWDAGDGCARLLGEKLAIIDEIAELKQELSEKDKEIESLKASHFEEMADAGMENHMLRRKLCLLRAEYAESRFAYYDNLDMTYRKDYVEERCGFWLKVKEYWQAKAEEYK